MIDDVMANGVIQFASTKTKKLQNLRSLLSIVFTGLQNKSAYLKIIFIISLVKHMLWVLKRASP